MRFRIWSMSEMIWVRTSGLYVGLAGGAVVPPGGVAVLVFLIWGTTGVESALLDCELTLLKPVATLAAVVTETAGVARLVVVELLPAVAPETEVLFCGSDESFAFALFIEVASPAGVGMPIRFDGSSDSPVTLFQMNAAL